MDVSREDLLTSRIEHRWLAPIRNQPECRCIPMEVTVGRQGPGCLSAEARQESTSLPCAPAAPAGSAAQPSNPNYSPAELYQVFAVWAVELAAGSAGWVDSTVLGGRTLNPRLRGRIESRRLRRSRLPSWMPRRRLVLLVSFRMGIRLSWIPRGSLYPEPGSGVEEPEGGGSEKM